jgi:hypothetical protein
MLSDDEFEELGRRLDSYADLKPKNPYLQEIAKERIRVTASLWRYQRYRRHLIATRVRKGFWVLFLIVLGVFIWHLTK